VEILTGTYFHSLDEKGRLVIPKKLRSKLSETVYAIPGPEGCLVVFGEKKFEEFSSNLSKLSFMKKETRDYHRIGFGQTIELPIDSASRIVLPPSTLAFYGLSKEVATIGCGDYFEIWDKERYDAYKAASLGTYPEVADIV
jgi:MraZ protein